jgi:hypothetical protein
MDIYATDLSLLALVELSIQMMFVQIVLINEIDANLKCKNYGNATLIGLVSSRVGITKHFLTEMKPG